MPSWLSCTYATGGDLNEANRTPWNSLPVFVLIGFEELLGRPVEGVVVRHLDRLVGEGVDACRANEAGSLRRRPDRVLQDETDGAVHAVDGHGRRTCVRAGGTSHG